MNEFAYDLDHTGEEEFIRAMLTISQSEEFVFFDVGANRGDWTGYLLKEAKREVCGHLFDISKTMIGRLTTRYAGMDNIYINHVGLSDKTEEREYKRYPNGEGVNSFIMDTSFWDDHLDHVIEEARTMTGDDYCRQHGIDHIDFLKIDTEGWEWPVLHGFDDMISDRRIEAIQFEYGYLTADMHVAMKDFWRFFEARGYAVGPLNKNGVLFRDFVYGDNQFRDDANYVAMIKERVNP